MVNSKVWRHLYVDYWTKFIPWPASLEYSRSSGEEGVGEGGEWGIKKEKGCGEREGKNRERDGRMEGEDEGGWKERKGGRGI